MPGFCCIKSCKSYARDGVRLFRIPAALSFSHQTELNTLSSDRREKWLTQINRSDLVGRRISQSRVCSKHFISGEPAHITDVGNPDWIPHLGMSNNALGESKTSIPSARSVNSLVKKNKFRKKWLPDQINGKTEILRELLQELPVKRPVLSKPIPVLSIATPVPTLKPIPPEVSPVPEPRPVPPQLTPMPPELRSAPSDSEPEPIEDARCLVCLSDDGQYNIFETKLNNSTISNILELCTSFNISIDDDKILKGICDVCYQQLLICNTFREKFMQSQNILRAIDTKNRIDESDKEDTMSIVSIEIKPEIVTEETPNPDPVMVVGEDHIILEVMADEDPLCDITVVPHYPPDNFLHYMDEVVDKIVGFTNLDRSRYVENKMYAFADLSKEELFALIGILIHSSATDKSKLSAIQLFDSSERGKFNRSLIRRGRFVYLLDALRFDDIETRSNEYPIDLFEPVRGVWELFMDKCKQSYVPAASSVMMINQYVPCDANCRFKQFSAKRIPNFAIEFQTFCDSASNYIVSSTPCLGHRSEIQVGMEWHKAKKDEIARFDQLWGTINCAGKAKRWPMVIFYTMINIALINSYSMHLSSNGSPSELLKHLQPTEVFLKSVADSLVQPLIKKREEAMNFDRKS